MKVWSRKQTPKHFPPKHQRHMGRFYRSLGSFCQVLLSFLPPSHHSVTFLRQGSWAACHGKQPAPK